MEENREQDPLKGSQEEAMENLEPKKKKNEGWGSYLLTLAIALVIALILRFFVFLPVTVTGSSMYDTLHNGDRVLAEKLTLSGLPKRFTVVVVEYPGFSELFVKRVIGLPGERVSVKEGAIYINGEKLSDPYNPGDSMMSDMEDVVVPEDHVFVMGDNRNDSMDSRAKSVGPIPRGAIRGKGLVLLWPLNRLKIL